MLLPLDRKLAFSPNIRILRDRVKTPAGEKSELRLLSGATGFRAGVQRPTLQNAWPGQEGVTAPRLPRF